MSGLTQVQTPQATEDKLKLDFIALVSHELRMPISAIIGYVELLMDLTYGPLTEEQQKTLTYMNQNARDLMRMVNDLLQLTNLQAGRAQLTLESVNLQTLVKDVLTSLAPLYKSKPLKVSNVVDDGLPMLRTDSGKLKQILVNLVSNAVKFTRQGEICVTARRVTSPLGEGEPWLSLEVRDTGVGIPTDKLKDMFKMFSQVDNKVSREFEGMGLGLYISQYLSQMLGGRITVASEENIGTTFTVQLPLQMESIGAVRRLTKMTTTGVTSVEAPRGEEPEEVAVAPGEQVVLVIGGDPDLSRLLGGSLKKEGFRALKATSVSAALDLLSQANPQAVFVDLSHSPNESWQLFQELKLDARVQNLPVIYLTDYGDSPPAVAAADAPLTVATPVQPKEVVDAMRKAARQNNRSRKVLVADDDEWIRMVLETALGDEGYQVLLAKDGYETIEQLEKERPDLLLLDLSMPGMTGWDVIRDIYSNAALKQVKVVVMTGQALSEEDIRMISQNIRGFLKKSEFKIEKILAEVRAVLQNA